MLLDVALTPGLLREPECAVCIVVDVLRASSACVTMFDRGVDEVVVAATPDDARSLRAEVLPGALLCGEVGGFPPAGFDYGNSPVEFEKLDLSGRRAIIATSNGTRALHAVTNSPEVFVGCLLNRAAVCEAAIAAARRLAAGVCIVCAGNDYGTAFSLDDAFAAGALVAGLEARLSSVAPGAEPDLTDAARMARGLFASYGGQAAGAFRDSSHARTLVRLGFSADLERCACLDVSKSVPALRHEPGGFLLLRATPGERGA